MTFRVINHFDVWGNEDDGYEVNDSSSVGTIELDDDANDDELIAVLIHAGHVVKGCSSSDFRIEWSDDTWCEIEEAARGYPLFALRAE